MSGISPTNSKSEPVKLETQEVQQNSTISEVTNRYIWRQSPVNWPSSRVDRCYSTDSIPEQVVSPPSSNSRDGVTPFIYSGDTNTPNSLNDCVERIKSLMKDLEAAKSHDSDTLIKSSFENLVSHYGSYINEQTEVCLDLTTFVEEGWVNRGSLKNALDVILDTLQPPTESFSSVAFDCSDL